MNSSSDRIIKTVMGKIARRRLVRARAAMTIHGVLILLAIAAFVPALEYAVGLATSSGFFDYLSLAISDNTLIAGYWKEFVLTLAESAPVASSGIVLGIFLVFTYSTREMAVDIKRWRTYAA